MQVLTEGFNKCSTPRAVDRVQNDFPVTGRQLQWGRLRQNNRCRVGIFRMNAIRIAIRSGNFGGIRSARRIEQRRGAFTGLTLATTRENILSAIMEGLIAASAEEGEGGEFWEVHVLV